MKIIWQPNPLHTIVELDEWEKKELWYKVKIDEMKSRLASAHFHLKEGTYFDLDKAREAVDTAFLFDENRSSKGKSEIDKEVDELHKHYLDALSCIHCGDCICFPASCEKCQAESLIGIDTIKGLGKHSASKIGAAFRDRRDINQAIDWLADYDPDRDVGPDSWKHKQPDTWASAVPRWKAEAKAAHEWLVRYRDEHFPMLSERLSSSKEENS